MLRALLPGLLVLAAQETSPPSPSAQAPRPGARYALIPPRNLTGAGEATAQFVDRLVRELDSRGASFVPPIELDLALRERRVRYTDSLSGLDLTALAERTGASHTLLATIFDFASGNEPRLAFSLRVLDNADGRRTLSRAIALRGVDFEGLLGLGRIEDVGVLADEAVARLLDDFDATGAPRTALAGMPARSRPEPPDGGFGFTRADFDPSTVERIAVLPFANRSRNLDAPAQLVEFLGDAWFREAGVQVVELSDLRAALRARKVRSLQFVDLQELAELGRAMGVRYFALGAIERYGDDVMVDDERFPEFEASVQIVDVERARIVAAAAVTRRGSDYRTLLGLGAVRDPTELALRAARELVLALGG